MFLCFLTCDSCTEKWSFSSKSQVTAVSKGSIKKKEDSDIDEVKKNKKHLDAERERKFQKASSFLYLKSFPAALI